MSNREQAYITFQRFSCTSTGLRNGETVIGIQKGVKGASFIYYGDTIPPRRKEIEWLKSEPDYWSLFINRLGSIHFFENLSNSEREEWIEKHATTKDIDISELGGKGTFLSFGENNNLTENIEESDKNDVMEQEKISIDKVRSLIPGKPGTNARRHTLAFLRSFWQVYVNKDLVDVYQGNILFDVNTGNLVDENSCSNNEKIHVIRGDNYEYGIKYNKCKALTEEDLVKNISKITGEDEGKNYKKFKKYTSFFTPAAYKSLLQKIIRYRAKNVTFPYYEDYSIKREIIEAKKSLLFSFISLFLSTGSFVPDIQRFVSGKESALKRLIITLYEDSCFEEKDVNLMMSINLSALLYQRNKEYNISKELMDKLLKFLVKIFDNVNYIWYGSIRLGELLNQDLPKININSIELENTFKSKLKFLSCIIDELKSFYIDLLMLRWCAKHYDDYYKKGNKPQCLYMPVEHCIDQHWATEYIYFVKNSIIEEYRDRVKTQSKPFEDIFHDVFIYVTGYNPRKHTHISLKEVSEPEEDSFVQNIRYAQLCSYISRSPFCENCKDIKIKTYKTKYLYEYELDDSWLAGMLGVIEIRGRPSVYVSLNSKNPYTFVAVRKPSRDIKSEKDAILSDERENKAILEAKKLLEKGIKLDQCSPPIPELKDMYLVIKEKDGEHEYYLKKVNGKLIKWDKIKVIKKEIPETRYRPPLKRDLSTPKGVDIIFDNVSIDYISLLLKKSEDGICKDWKKRVRYMLSHFDIEECKKAISYLKGFNFEIEMNRISRDGGGTKYSVSFDDVGAYQIILQISNIAPSAIYRKNKNTHIFKVKNGPLLWMIRDYIQKLIYGKISYKSDRWGKIRERKGRILRQHQVDSLNDMKTRHEEGKANHFLWLTVGSGKTLIVLSYLKYLKENNQLPPYIIYTLPGSSMESIVNECIYMGFEVSIIDGRKTIPKTAIRRELRVKCDDIQKYKINIIEHDHLRRCEDELKHVATKSIFVVDEVHKALNETKRTSVALEISKMSKEVIALTGTPIIDTHTYKLMWWLKQIVNFEVNNNNFWVAANGMIAKKFNPNITIKRTEVIAEMSEKESEEYRKYVPVNMGGNNSYPSNQDFLTAMNICYEVATKYIVEETMKKLKKGGVFVVAKDSKHAEDLRKRFSKKIKEKDIFVINSNDSIHLTDDSVKNGVHDYKIVISTIRKSEGYTLTRLKSMIMSVYPSNGASREQVEGRVVRIGQSAKEVEFITIHVGILTYILQRHKDVKNITNVLKKLADDI